MTSVVAVTGMMEVLMVVDTVAAVAAALESG